MSTSQRFAHSGDLGDIVYSLPTIRACGGGRLALFDMPGRTAHGMTQERAERIIPLLKAQRYIDDAFFTTDTIDHNINGFRDHPHGNLADKHLSTMGLSWRERDRKWLQIDKPTHAADVVICRTERYRNDQFPWGRVLQTYAGRIAFVGVEREHQVFVDQFGDVPLLKLDNLLDVARVIAGSRLYIGNYTAATAIAEGLKHPSVVEVCPYCHHLAMFHRLGVAHGWDSNVELPEL